MKNKIIMFFTLVTTAWMLGCTDEMEKVVYKQNKANYTAPEILNEETKPVVVITPENAANHYETIKWTKSDYGVNLAVKYIVQIDDNEDFSNPQSLGTTLRDSLSITNGMLNNAILALGYEDGDDAEINVRVISMLNDFNSNLDGDTLTSASIVRAVKVYQDSECGNFCTIGIIGSATAGGWDIDTDMHLADPTRTDKYSWTVIVYLTVGEAKFRASDDWETNWGSGAFPNGTGTQGGANIPIGTAGYYRVNLNDQTGEYSFTALATPVYSTVGIIGDATPGGWDNDTDLTQDADNPHLWTGTITLTAGEAKFRANDSWDVNWGSNTYPSGNGVGNGANIPVSAGTYFVRFNDATGEYSFMKTDRTNPFATIGIVGFATTGSDDGWNSDKDMIQNPANPYKWSKIITLFEGNGKFRADDGWDVNWGATSFPGGIGVQNGADIPMKAGTYFVTFNSGTGEYYFLK